MVQDTLSFTKNLKTPSVIEYIQEYFDEHMVMYEIAELCNFKDNVSVSYDNQLVYHVKQLENAAIICERLSQIRIPMYGNMYQVVAAPLTAKSIDIKFINEAASY